MMIRSPITALLGIVTAMLIASGGGVGGALGQATTPATTPSNNQAAVIVIDGVIDTHTRDTLFK